jgi:phosphate starvation-inducible protein PhoH
VVDDKIIFMNITLEIDSSEQLSNICGSFDRHLEAIAKSLNVEMNNKGEAFIIKGDNEHIAVRVLQDLTTLSKTQSIQILYPKILFYHLILLFIALRKDKNNVDFVLRG